MWYDKPPAKSKAKLGDRPESKSTVLPPRLNFSNVVTTVVPIIMVTITITINLVFISFFSELASHKVFWVLIPDSHWSEFSNP